MCPTLCDPMDCSTQGFPVLHHLPEFAQTHVCWVSDAIQPSHPLLPPSPPALNLSQFQGLFQWVSSSHQVAKVLELQLQHQSFQCVHTHIYVFVYISLSIPISILYFYFSIYWERKKYPPKYAAWLVDSANPSLRRSLIASPGVEQWAGELSNIKFLLLDVLMIRGGRSTLMTVCSSSCTSGCSSHGLSEGQSLEGGSGNKSKSQGKLSTLDTEKFNSLSNSKLEHPRNSSVFPTKYSFSYGQK